MTLVANLRVEAAPTWQEHVARRLTLLYPHLVGPAIGEVKAKVTTVYTGVAEADVIPIFGRDKEVTGYL